MKADGSVLSTEDAKKIILSKFDESIPEQHQMKLLFGCGVYCAFCGCSEHTRLHTNQIVFGQYPENFENPALCGVQYASVAVFLSDKSHSITVNNSYAREMKNVLRFPIDTQDPSSFGGAIKRFWKKLSPGQSRVYCQVAGLNYQRTLALSGHPNSIFYPSKPLGDKKIHKLFKKGAQILGLPSNFKPHSLRGACITRLVNDDSVSLAETMMVARHNSASASKSYQRVDGISETNRLKALGIITTSALQKLKAERESLNEDDMEVDEEEEYVNDSDSTCVTRNNGISLTQVGIEGLRNDIEDLEESLEAKGKRKRGGSVSLTQEGLTNLRGEIDELRGIIVKKPRSEVVKKPRKQGSEKA